MHIHTIIRNVVSINRYLTGTLLLQQDVSRCLLVENVPIVVRKNVKADCGIVT